MKTESITLITSLTSLIAAVISLIKATKAKKEAERLNIEIGAIKNSITNSNNKTQSISGIVGNTGGDIIGNIIG